ncbi:ATP-binding protein [Streptomyces sp. S1]|uniref:ATP-binding protein n=1 Tax=Streptomyces sp. S1 TaxID=718288 RepID=UPI000EF77122|nr:ATP-binding protein [Streptomyces sp. S1]
MILTAEVQTPRPFRTVRTRDLMPDEKEPGRLRHWIGERLARLGLDVLADDLSLIAGELAANALLHGRAPARVTMTVVREADGTGAVHLECVDSGPGFDLERMARVRDCAPEELLERCHGRGLLIIAALSSRWGYRRTTAGHAVWAEIGLSAPVDGPRREGGAA